MTEIEKLPEVARRIYTDCKKCDSQRYHVVLAHLSSSSAKVECEVCKGKKTYKLKSARKKVTSSVKKKPSTRSPAKHWMELKQNYNSSTVQPYSMKVCFPEGAVIDHPKFGLGFVTGVAGQAIQVVFEDGLRSLVHNR